MFRDYLIAMTLLKFDIMFSVLNVLSSGYGLFNTGGLLALDIIMIVLSLVYAVLGWQGVRCPCRSPVSVTNKPQFLTYQTK
jgi:hypothetical protein